MFEINVKDVNVKKRKYLLNMMSFASAETLSQMECVNWIYW